MIATALQGFASYSMFPVELGWYSDRQARGQIKANLPLGEVLVSLDGYALHWTHASLAQVQAVRLHWRTYEGHTAFEWVPPPIDVPATLWVYEGPPVLGGVSAYQIDVRIVPFRT